MRLSLLLLAALLLMGCGGTLRCGTCEEPTTALEPLLPLTGEEPVTWEEMYELCTEEDYPAGYRPPLFVRPTEDNTGANCPDKASGCPADAVLTNITNYSGINESGPGSDYEITQPGTYENFYVEGELTVSASNVTLRNFEIRCANQRHAIMMEDDNIYNYVIEYGTVKKGSGFSNAGYCDRCLVTEGTTGHYKVKALHCDQTKEDGAQSAALDGPILIERSLFTRIGPGVGYQSGNDSHADIWQYLFNNQGEHACMLGIRVVPGYCPNFYKQDNLTQNFDYLGPSRSDGRFFIYNSWVDGSANNLIGTEGGYVIGNTKFGNFTHASLWGSAEKIFDNGGNVWECDNSPVTEACRDVSECSPQATCPWGFSNSAVNGWDGANWDEDGKEGPWDSNNNKITCTGTIDSQLVDPTKNCTSDGSGCIYTHGGFTP